MSLLIASQYLNENIFKFCAKYYRKKTWNISMYRYQAYTLHLASPAENCHLSLEPNWHRKWTGKRFLTILRLIAAPSKFNNNYIKYI